MGTNEECRQHLDLELERAVDKSKARLDFATHSTLQGYIDCREEKTVVFRSRDHILTVVMQNMSCIRMHLICPFETCPRTENSR